MFKMNFIFFIDPKRFPSIQEYCNLYERYVEIDMGNSEE